MGKKYSHLSSGQRYQIDALLRAGVKVQEIAGIIGVHYSTVYREIKRATYVHRNSDWTEEVRYAPDTANQRYREKLKEKGRELKIGKDYDFARYIEHKIVDEEYSPEAALMAADNEKFATRICIKTLYSYIDRGIFLNVTNKDLPIKKNKKREYKRVRVQKRAATGTSIEKRDKEIEKREEFGHWEMDSVVGKKGVSKKAFLVLTERKTRTEIVILLKEHKTKNVVAALNRIEKSIGTENFRKIFKSITVDNGCEFADFEGMETARRSGQKKTYIYYCHPYSSYERGTNENNNRLIRRHIPKGTVFDDMTSTEVRELQDWMNRYPRKLLKRKCSAEVLSAELDKLELGDKADTIKKFLLPRGFPANKVAVE